MSFNTKQYNNPPQSLSNHKYTEIAIRHYLSSLQFNIIYLILFSKYVKKKVIWVQFFFKKHKDQIYGNDSNK